MSNKDELINEISKRSEFTKEFLRDKSIESLQNFYDILVTREQITEIERENVSLESKLNDNKLKFRVIQEKLDSLIIEAELL